MPIATIETPDGRVVKLEVPEGATEDQIMQFVESQGLGSVPAQPPAQEEVLSDGVNDSGGVPRPNVEAQGETGSLGRVDSSLGARIGNAGRELLGNIEATGAIASGFAAEPVAGLRGIGAALIPGGQTGAEAVESTRQALTYQPRTQEGQETLGQIGQLAEMIPDVSGAAGDVAFYLTGSPLAGATATTLVGALPELVGLGAIRGIRTGTKLLDSQGRPTQELRKELDKQGLVFDNLSPEAKAAIPDVADQSFVSGSSLISESAEEALKQQIKAGGRDDALAGLTIKGDRIAPDPLGREALRQGYAPGFIQSVKVASPETKAQMQKMLDISRRIKSSERVGLDIRPGDVVGNSVAKRVNHIRDTANAARKELNEIASTKLEGKQIDTGIVRNALAQSLDDLDVSVTVTDRGLPVPDFKGSIISKDRSSQKAIKDAIDLLSEGGAPDALRAHKLKRQLDNIIDFNKKASTGLGEEGRSVLKSLRRALNESVRAVDPDYARVNDTLSKSISTLDDFEKAVGSSIDVFGEGAESAIGTRMRGLMSNIQSRVKLENSINQLDDVAAELGGNFGDDVKDLAMFANALDTRFGAVAKTSLTGSVEQAMNRVINQGVSNELYQQGAGVATKAYKKLSGINDFNAYESLDKILKRGK